VDRAGPVSTWKGYRLLGFQVQAIEALRGGRNVLVSAPTGAGKTLVAEYAIADAVARGKRCVYTAPIKALSNQKYRDFRDDPEIDVGLMTGDVTIHPRAQVLIMTTEILRNSIFENPGGLRDVDYVIFDEVHFMDDPERGTVWEESLIFAPQEIRFISLSATIQNLDQLGSWMREIREHELEVIRSDRRPVPLKHRLFAAGVGVFDPGRLDWVQRNAERLLGRPARRERRGRSERGRRHAQGPERFETGIDELLDQLEGDGLLPALVFSFSRKDCERLAGRSQRRQLLDEEEVQRMRALQSELLGLFQLDPGELEGEVFRLAARGVGYHHAGMLPIHKEVVERMFTSGLIKMLFTTETFALGINMPARTVVFSSLRKFDGLQFDYLRTREYMQMAGRAGRQGIDREGLVVSALDQRTLAEAPLRRILSGRPEPVESRFRLSYSSILHLLPLLGRARLHEAWEKSFNQFQHRAKGKKARERNRDVQRQLVDAHLALLEEQGYIDARDQLTPKGGVAKLLYGFELQIAEMLAGGDFEALPPKALAVVFVGLVHEERRGSPESRPPARLFGGLRRHVDRKLDGLAGIEASHGLPPSIKLPDWGLTEAIVRWFEGADFEEVCDSSGSPPGDVCRVFRMALQLMRQVRRTLDPRDDLVDRIEAAIEAVNRDEVDARRQLELG
jgi:superfamily II RNA helicase